MALTQVQIFGAADELDARGQAPTLVAVREMLGGGSYTTISQAMNAWKKHRAARPTTPAEPLPEGLAAALADLGQTVWSAASELAHTRLAGEREAFEQERSQMEEARQEAVQLADALTVELEQLQAQLQHEMARTRDAEQALAGAREELTSTKVRAASAESRAEELGARVTALTEEAGRLHAHSEQLGQALTRLAGAQAGQKGRRGSGSGEGEGKA